MKLIKDALGYHMKELDGYKLSLKNCQAIANGYDLDEIKRKLFNRFDGQPDSFTIAAVERTVDIMFESLSDKKFSEEDMENAIEMCIKLMNDKGSEFREHKQTVIQSLQQTQWDVEVVMKNVIDETKIVGAIKGVKGSGNKITTYKQIPKLDADDCLILKRT